MHVDTLIRSATQLVTPGGTGALHGADMSRLDILEQPVVAIHDGHIVWIGTDAEWDGVAATEIDARAGVLLPALIDPHTHLVWADDRLDDFDARTRGESYEEILQAGGGIWSSIGAVQRWADEEQGVDLHDLTLLALAEERIEPLIASGAATIEVKSGYGFDADTELLLLRVIAALDDTVAGTIIPTLLIHVPPRHAAERAGYLTMVTGQLIPEAARRGLARAVDVFIEEHAFRVDEARQIFGAARRHGLAVKAHVDQFHAIGGVELAVECDALSVDHLEASGPAQIAAVAASSTIATLLPGVTLHLGLPAAPGRQLIDAGAAVAVGTDCNPGSSPLFSAQLAMALAIRLNRLTVAEALTACTANAAAALGLHDRGRLAVGQRADLIITDYPDWRDAAYTMGRSPVAALFIAGKQVTS
jgi:imidazolonepropionase